MLCLLIEPEPLEPWKRLILTDFQQCLWNKRHFYISQSNTICSLWILHQIGSLIQFKSWVLCDTVFCHLDKRSAILLHFPATWQMSRAMSHWAAVMKIFLAIVANTLSLVLPLFKTATTALLSQWILFDLCCHFLAQILMQN